VTVRALETLRSLNDVEPFIGVHAPIPPPPPDVLETPAFCAD
jgi:hypothetical protein